MIRSVNIVEKSVIALPPVIVTGVANANKEVLPDFSTFPTTEYSGRYIFNAGAANLYYAFGVECDNVASYHGWMVPGQMLDCSNHGARVCCYSTGAIVAATTILKRNDLIGSPQMFPARNP